MRTSVEVLERMGEIVVHARTRYGDSPNDVAETTIVLDDFSARELCAQVSALLDKRARLASPNAPAPPERWYKVEARNRDRRGPTVAYARGRSDDEARRLSELGRLHEAEVVVMRMPEDFEPPA